MAEPRLWRCDPSSLDRLYLDICCFKRPFDDRRQARIRRQAEAVSTIIDQAELDRMTELGRRHAGILRTIIANPVDWEQELLE